MFLTNRSLLALWLAILFLALFVLVLATITQHEEMEFLGVANCLETIFFFAMGTIQTEMSRVKSQMANNEPVQEPAKRSGLAQFLEAVINVAILFAFAVTCSILNLFLPKITEYVHVFFWSIGILMFTASMLFTLRSQRQAAFEKRKQMPSNLD